jgi:hypothetical protein
MNALRSPSTLQMIVAATDPAAAAADRAQHLRYLTELNGPLLRLVPCTTTNLDDRVAGPKASEGMIGDRAVD